MGVSNLSPYTLAIQSAVGKGKNALNGVSADVLGRIADQVFGPAPVPPGSQILYQDAINVRWRDPEGYEHVAQRSLDGRDPNAGRWNEQTNRPSVLPNQGAQSLAGTLQGQLQQQFAAPTSLAQLDPETAKALLAISQAEQAKNQQQFETEQGQALASLYGNRVNESSIANDAIGRLIQLHGLVTQQQQSDAAAREMAARQYLTGLGQQNRELMSGLYSNLIGQDTQRQIASSGIDLDKLRLGEQSREANQGFELNQQQADMALADQRSVFNKVLKGIQAVGTLAGGAGTAIGAYNALTRPR